MKKILVSIVVVLFSLVFSVSVKAQTFITGFELLASHGDSYNNPSVGGFFETRSNFGRFVNINTFGISNDQKVFLPNGFTYRGQAEFGFMVCRNLSVSGLVGFGQQRNIQYTKAILNPGVSVRQYFRKGFEAYATYKSPDLLSVNKVSGFEVGVDKFWRTRRIKWFLEASEHVDNWTQYYSSPKINMYGFGVAARIGFWFSRSRER